MLANKGAEEAESLNYVTPFVPISQKELKNLVHDTLVDVWNDTWLNTDGCRVSKCFYPNVRENERMAKRTIEELSTLAKFVTGHGLFKKHLYQWSDIDTDQCSLCHDDKEDSWHLWNNCPGTGAARRELKYLREAGMSMESAILRLSKTKQVKSLLELNDSLIQLSAE